MIGHDCEQGTQQWLDLHIGIPTASRFGKLVTSKTMKPSAQRRGLVLQLAAEYMTGEVVNEGLTTQFMQRGLGFEAQARLDYGYDHDLDVEEVGFLTTDDEHAGCSPDGLIGGDGGLEIKIPGPATHVGYMLEPESLVAAYRAQVQGCLWISERRWWDIMSWNRPAGLPDVLRRVERDEEYIAALAEAVGQVALEVNDILIQFGYRQEVVPTDESTPPPELPKNAGCHGLGLAEGDPAAAFSR